MAWCRLGPIRDRRDVGHAHGELVRFDRDPVQPCDARRFGAVAAIFSRATRIGAHPRPRGGGRPRRTNSIKVFYVQNQRFEIPDKESAEAKTRGEASQEGPSLAPIAAAAQERRSADRIRQGHQPRSAKLTEMADWVLAEWSPAQLAHPCQAKEGRSPSTLAQRSRG